MAADFNALSGDVAGLVGYHRSPHGAMVHDDEITAVIGHYGLKIVGSVQLIPREVWEVLDEIPFPQVRDPWIPFDEYHPSRAADLITVALSIFGVILALVAAICLLITAWNGWV